MRPVDQRGAAEALLRELQVEDQRAALIAGSRKKNPKAGGGGSCSVWFKAVLGTALRAAHVENFWDSMEWRASVYPHADSESRATQQLDRNSDDVFGCLKLGPGFDGMACKGSRKDTRNFKEYFDTHTRTQEGGGRKPKDSLPLPGGCSFSMV